MLFNIYLICLLVGAIYGLVSLFFNGVLDGLDVDFDFDFDGFALPLKPFTIMSFVAVFGGVGLIGLHFFAASPLLSLIPAVLLGVLVSALLYWALYVKLRKYESETPREDDAIMRRAEVVERIPPGGYGKISYVMDGNTLSGAAKEKKPGAGIDKGKQVYILEIHENVHLVCEDLEVYLES